MSNFLYHGSYTKGLTQLRPFSKSHNTIKKSVVYLTPNSTYALLYIWNRPYKWVTFDVDDDGILVFKEVFEHQLFEFYNGISGYIYECYANNPDICKTHINCVYNSEKTIPITGYQTIENVYNEILNREKQGEIRISRYSTLSNEEKQKISTDTVRAIHMQKLLATSDESDVEKQLINFVKDKFPNEWEIAGNQTQEEIEHMINLWKRSVGI